MDEYAVEYRQLSELLMKYGGVVAPFILGGEWAALSAFAATVAEAPPADDAARAAVEKRFDELLENTAFHPNYRAQLVHRSISLPHMSRCSHLIERAVLHYYKGDFLSCVLVLLPAVEGVLRSYVGWSLGDQEPSWPAVRERLRGAAAETYPERRQAYVEALCAFHERWFWQRTAEADFRLSYLNRHYALHSLGTECFYRATDCHRLFLYVRHVRRHADA